MTQARDLGDAANKANFLDNVSSDIAALIASATPAGVIVPFGGTTAPSGYLACQGQIVSRSTYADLFAAIGTTWNLAGESSSEFRLPDLRGAFLRGTGTHMSSNMANGNDFAGPSVGSFENDQFQGHLFGDVGSYIGTQTAPLKISDNRRNQSPSSSSDNNHGVVDTQANSYGNALIPINDQTNGTPRTGDETRPFNAGILYCIKT